MNVKIYTILFCLPASLFAYAGDWEYSQNHDEMRGITSYYANLDSTNSVDLLSPYSGGSKLTIAVYSNDDNLIKNAGLFLSKGMIDCNKSEDCIIHVKFDNGVIQELHTSMLTDDYDVLGIPLPKSFIQSAKIAKSLIIEIPLYKNGEKQFKFNLPELKWKTEKDGELFKSSFGNINLSEKVTLPDNAKINDRGYMCFNLDKFSISDKLSQQGKAEICTYKGYFLYAQVRYPYSNSNFGFLSQFINKQLGAKEKLSKGFNYWSGIDYTDGLSTIYLSNSKKDGLELFFDYSPTGDLVPPSTSKDSK
ncbi:hypothetical protein CHS65_004846 [Salmonella enterica]|nr:hypothetical protein [Salmonella enterica subsp. enterica]ECC2476555.1 hypothetical protein [Salmonella enterica]EDB6213254.1 hypothetical protein [Salmonella enterica subsp. enterica serovar Typhimurium]EEM0289000.1 hypothetical protein [Salmonella enterica subsp. enterica serovar Sandiego]ECC9712177.1 hypothetical protein [Salmonella enterica subsp. enterica]